MYGFMFNHEHWRTSLAAKQFAKLHRWCSRILWWKQLVLLLTLLLQFWATSSSSSQLSSCSARHPQAQLPQATQHNWHCKMGSVLSQLSMYRLQPNLPQPNLLTMGKLLQCHWKMTMTLQRSRHMRTLRMKLCKSCWIGRTKVMPGAEA